MGLLSSTYLKALLALENYSGLGKLGPGSGPGNPMIAIEALEKRLSLN